MQQLMKIITQDHLYILVTVVLLLISYGLVSFFLRKIGKNPKYLLPKGSFKKLSWPLILILFSIFIRIESFREVLGLSEFAFWFKKGSTLLLIFSFTWFLLVLLGIVKKIVTSTYNIEEADNLKARQVYTQFNILERIGIFVIIILALGAALMTFESIREIGVSVFASAGVAGIIIGFSAQKFIGTIIAGIQIAIAQPIKLDDVVIVEGEWGRIEEITLTYVVVKIWDKRRLIVPTPYFIDKPFQNWTKTNSDILGTVFLYTDYDIPFEALRKELDHILKNTDLWDGELGIIQVTDTKPTHVESRILVSAKDASTAWDLRVHIREKMVVFIQNTYPQSIARTRVRLVDSSLEKQKDDGNS